MNAQLRRSWPWLLLLALLTLPPAWPWHSAAWGPAGMETWQITEWLIDYDSGFVRRGLPGTVLKHAALATGIAPSHLAIVLAVLLYGALCWLACRLLRGVLPPYVVLGPLFLGIPLLTDQVVRKDALIVLLVVGAIVAVTSKAPLAVRIALASTAGILATLSHESFAFVGLPLVGVFAALAGGGLTKVRALAGGLLAVAPTAVVVALAIASRGTAADASSISAAWNRVTRDVAPGYCCYDQPYGAIDALGWELQRAWDLQHDVLHAFIGPVWVPLIWLATWLGVGVLLAAVTGHQRASAGRTFVTLYLFQTLCAVPLFVLGVDYGRWIFLVSLTAGLATALHERRGLRALPAVQGVRLMRLGRLLDTTPGRLALVALPGVPACCWTIGNFTGSTPIGPWAGAFASLVGLR